MRELISRFLVAMFSANETVFSGVAAIVMIVEVVLTNLVILNVNYTEIDWSTYMQQVECYANKGILNYTQIGGDTGPVVYPAGHIFVYRALHFFTNSGKNIRVAQHIFQGFYLFNLFMVFRILQKTMRIPPVVLLLVSVTGYRIHSIFMLRLFNDPLAMLLFYLAMDHFLDQNWLVGCIFYSLAVSIKMNVLLFAPALFFTLLLNNNYMPTLGYLTICGLIQLYVGSPFLLHDWKSYVQRSFDLGRVFMFKWTVNWRFLPEEIFLDKRFHIALLIGHLTFLAFFAWHMWFRRLNGLRVSLSLRIFKGITTCTGALDTYYAFCTSNLIGIAFSRSLHYQFYSWYFHQLPFLLFCDYPDVQTVSQIPWKQFFWKVPLLLAIELCWNVYPSTWWSSALLHLCHIIIFCHLIKTRPARPVDSVSPHTWKKLQTREEVLDTIVDKHGQVVPKCDFSSFLAEDEAEIQERIGKMKRRQSKPNKSKSTMKEEFENYYAEQLMTFKQEHEVYRTKDGEIQVTGLPPIGDKKKLKLHEKVTALYAQALSLQAKLNKKGKGDETKKLKSSSTNRNQQLLDSYLKLHSETPDDLTDSESDESYGSSILRDCSSAESSPENEEDTDKIPDKNSVSCTMESLASEDERLKSNGVRQRIPIASQGNSKF